MFPKNETVEPVNWIALFNEDVYECKFETFAVFDALYEFNGFNIEIIWSEPETNVGVDVKFEYAKEPVIETTLKEPVMV